MVVDLLFVYGSLRRGFKSDAYAYLSEFFDYVGDGKAQGRLADIGPYPVAVPTTEERFIVGELYKLRHPSDYNYAMMQLDDYEGVFCEPHETPLYRRELTSIYINNDKVPAWIYWYSKNVDGYPTIESGDLLQYLESKQG